MLAAWLAPISINSAYTSHTGYNLISKQDIKKEQIERSLFQQQKKDEFRRREFVNNAPPQSTMKIIPISIIILFVAEMDFQMKGKASKGKAKKNI